MKINYFSKIGKTNPVNKEKAKKIDPFVLVEALHYKNSSSTLTYELLREIARKNSIIAGIIQTRINQLSLFARPIDNDNIIGFKIEPKDKTKKITKKMEKEIAEITEFIKNTGRVEREKDLVRDTFVEFTKKIFQDRLIFDQAVFEKVRTRKGELYEFIAVDGATIRLSNNIKDIEEKEKQKLDKIKEKPVRYVQVINGNIVAEFTIDDLAFCPANLSTNIYNNGYGISEMEYIINAITSHLWAEEYNRRFFSQGSAPKGILNIKGDIPDDQLDAFRQKWHSQVAGINNAWKTPVMSAEELQWIDLEKSNKEMEFGKWIDYLVNVICAVYQIEPSEINFQNRGGSATGSAIFENNYEKKVKYSKDKGLKPLLLWYEDILNKHIIRELSDKYVLKFIGLDEQTEQEKLDILKRESEIYKTINEIRQEKGLSPITNVKSIGDIVPSPQFLQALMSFPPGEGGEGEGEGMPENEGQPQIPENEETSENSNENTENDTNDLYSQIFGSKQSEQEQAQEETEKNITENKNYKIIIKKIKE